MSDQDKRRATTRRRGDLKDIDDKKVSGSFWQLPPVARGGKRKAKDDAQPNDESESSQTGAAEVANSVVSAANNHPQDGTSSRNEPPAITGASTSPAVAAPPTPAADEDEISLKPAQVKQHAVIPTLAVLAEKEINKDAAAAALAMPPPPPPPPLQARDKNDQSEEPPNGGNGRKLKRSRGKDFPEPSPSITVGKLWMMNRDVLGPLMYHTGQPLGDLDGMVGKTLQVYCPARYISHRNPEVIARHLWGSHPSGYTDDSDLVCMLLHSALVHGGDVGPTDIAGVIAYVKVIPGLSSYPSAWDYSNKKLMKSRKWAQPYPYALQVQRVELLERDHLVRSTYVLPQRSEVVTTPRRQPLVDSDPGSEPEIALKLSKVQQQSQRVGRQAEQEEDDEANEVMQSLSKPKHHAQPGHSRHVPKKPQQDPSRTCGDTVVMYNFSNEICKKYSLAAVMDKGLEQQQWTAFRLKTQVLYFESDHTRYELSRLPPSAEVPFDRYRLARVLSPFHADFASWPLPLEYTQVIDEKLDWNEIQWGTQSCFVRGKSFSLLRIFWRNIRTVVPPPELAPKSPRKQKAETIDTPAPATVAAAAAPLILKEDEAQPAADSPQAAGGTTEKALSATVVHLKRAAKKKKGKE